MNKPKQIAIAGLLTAIAILIPIIMPIKLILPASTYTLASHVPIFVAMFISPQVAIMVALGTTLGFFMSLPFIVAARAFSHLAFVIPGAYYLQKHTLKSAKSQFVFNSVMALIHGIAEFTIVALISFKQLSPDLLLQFFIFLGIGTIIHSTVDFYLSLSVVKTLGLDN